MLSQQSPGSVSTAVLPTLESLGPSSYPLCWGTASEGCLNDTPPQACLQSRWGKNPCQAALLQGVGRANQLLDPPEGPISSRGYQWNLNTAFLIPCMAHRVGETSTPVYTAIDGCSRKMGRDWDLSVYIQGKEPTSASLPISDLGGWGANKKPKLKLSSSLQATCPPQLSSLDSILLCHPCPSFRCPHRQSWCPSGLALAWLPSVRFGMREEAQCGREMW